MNVKMGSSSPNEDEHQKKMKAPPSQDGGDIHNCSTPLKFHGWIHLKISHPTGKGDDLTELQNGPSFYR